MVRIAIGAAVAAASLSNTRTRPICSRTNSRSVASGACVTNVGWSKDRFGKAGAVSIVVVGAVTAPEFLSLDVGVDKGVFKTTEYSVEGPFLAAVIARLAAEKVKEIPVHVLDNGNLSLGVGLLARHAAMMAENYESGFIHLE